MQVPKFIQHKSGFVRCGLITKTIEKYAGKSSGNTCIPGLLPVQPAKLIHQSGCLIRFGLMAGFSLMAGFGRMIVSIKQTFGQADRYLAVPGFLTMQLAEFVQQAAGFLRFNPIVESIEQTAGKLY